MHPFRRISAFVPFLLAGAFAGACSDANSLGDPTANSVVDTVTLGALQGTPISTPSGFNITNGPVRTDASVDFEFAYNVRRLADGSYQRVLLPRAALGLASASSADPGLQQRTEPFDGITRAGSNGYVTDSAVPIEKGQRLVSGRAWSARRWACRSTARSRSSTSRTAPSPSRRWSTPTAGIRTSSPAFRKTERP
jgi:hypothetical protein